MSARGDSSVDFQSAARTGTLAAAGRFSGDINQKVN